MPDTTDDTVYATSPASPWFTLTPRERDVAHGIAEGRTNRAIAEELKISIKTVDTHRSHLLKKLGCKNNVLLVRYMLKEGVATL